MARERTTLRARGVLLASVVYLPLLYCLDALGQAESVMVQSENLTHRFGAREAVSGLSFDVARGQIFGVLGPNGGGKSTLFRILATHARAVGRTRRVAGFDVDRASRPRCAAQIGVVFQSHSLDRKLTVDENLTARATCTGCRGRAARPDRRGRWMRLSITNRADDLVDTLSGGLQRRVEIAKALLHRPDASC